MLIEESKINRYKKGEIIFKEGDEGDSFHIIRKGSVAVSRLIDGSDVTQTYVQLTIIWEKLHSLAMVRIRTALILSLL